MVRGLGRALRFRKGWNNPALEVRESEVEVSCRNGTVPATLLLPPGGTPPFPGWVTLHGITRPGRSHPTLLRFVRALAYSGSAVLLPEIQEWTELDLAPKSAGQVLEGAVLTLAGREEVDGARVGAIGFSFGAPQVLLAASHPELSRHLKAVVGFGSYAELEATLRFMFFGEHELNGTRFKVDPDPYGRWVVAGNYLTRAPGYEDSADVAEALLRLARAAGDQQVGAWEDVYEALKDELALEVEPARHSLFRALAASGAVTDSEASLEGLVHGLARTATRISPILDFRSRLEDLAVPVRLIHGRQDRLIPFSETVKLAQSLPPSADSKVFLTGMFSHSQPDSARARLGEMRERVWFIYLMAEILGLL